MDYKLLENDEFRAKFVKENYRELAAFLDGASELAEQLTLSEWNEIFIYPFDVEAIEKGWRATRFQDVLGDIWDSYNRSRTLAPREHLKTHTALSYVIKRVYTRKYPLEINYYHISDEIAGEKFRKMQRVIERNPLLAHSFDIANARSWKEDRMELSDGTIISPMSYNSSAVGKHPHIIILDDIIDFRVMYSDDRNERAITKFYTDIYPQISKDEPDKKVIVIGTAQRKGDIYHKLPEDYKTFTFKAIIDEQRQQVLSPEIFTYARLMQIKEDMSKKLGLKFFLKEYQNTPFEGLGIIVKQEYLQFYHKLSEEFIRTLAVYQGWDLSVGRNIEKNDWTAGITLGIETRYDEFKVDRKIYIYILDIFRARLKFADRIKAILKYHELWKPLAVGIEDVAFQYDTVTTMQESYAIPVIPVKAITNKVQSFQVEVGPYFENKQVYMAEWMEDFKLELLSLPVGEFDDQADAFKIAMKTYLLNPYGKMPDATDEEDDTKEEDSDTIIGGDILDRDL